MAKYNTFSQAVDAIIAAMGTGRQEMSSQLDGLHNHLTNVQQQTSANDTKLDKLVNYFELGDDADTASVS